MKLMSSKINFLGIACLLIVVVFPVSVCSFERTSQNYRIQADSINIESVEGISAPNYRLWQTIGEEGTDISTTTNYKIQSGMRHLLEAKVEPVSEGNLPLRSVADFEAPEIQKLVVKQISTSTYQFSWETDEPCICKFFFGKEKEKLEEFTLPTEKKGLTKIHLIEVKDLLPDTTYFYQISCQDKNRNITKTLLRKFQTLPLPDKTPPANIKNFQAIAGDKMITLKWQNPPDEDFKEVKIFRSEIFYPKTPAEGKLVYQGAGTYFEDKGLINGKRYYYTAFAYDKAGNYSSGAIASAVPQRVIPEKPILPEKPPIFPPPEKPVLPEISAITLENFEFWQAGKILFPKDGVIEILKEKPFTISVDYQSLPEVLKTILVTLEKDGKYFSFLLRVNKEKTRYLATILPPEIGRYPFTIYILDYKNQTLREIKGKLEVVEKKQARQVSPKVSKPAPRPSPKEKMLEKAYLEVLILVGIVLIILIVLLVYLKRKIKPGF